MNELLLQLLVEPLMQIYRVLHDFVPVAFGEGARIAFFSVAVNLLLMPLYAQMERKSRAGREVRARVTAEVSRMKRHFRGRELYYYIRAVHRQFGYRPISHLLGSADLIVQVLVFATVYHFLSGLDDLRGASLGPLSDLSKPDGLLWGINALPFVMTAINAASIFAYVDDPGRRLQAMGLATIFLVLLYGSPSGLVFYWTLNNLFSLVRTRVQKRMSGRTPGRVARTIARLQRQS